ncbi:hypothetical protein Lal_00037120 [Lupinus albus]|nr:hypothetical protein Lal_00037120 [Lupinus albus]
MSVHAWRNAGHADKNEFICIAGGYHGETVGALGVTDTPLFRSAYEALLRPAHIAVSPDARLAAPGESAAEVSRRALADVQRLLQERSGRIAAIIVEPLVQCAAGMAMHDPDYVRGLRALCDAHGAHLIADEIAVGCGRTGSFFACEQARVWPDLLCLSKGISGGYLPLSLVMASDAIYAAFYDDEVRRGFLHSHSYTGNALACRAALATLDIFEQDQVIERNRRFAPLLAQALQPLAQDARVKHVRQRGMIWACDAQIDDAATAAAFSRRLAREAAQRELLVRPIGTALYVMPPYVIDEEQAQWRRHERPQLFRHRYRYRRGQDARGQRPDPPACGQRLAGRGHEAGGLGGFPARGRVVQRGCASPAGGLQCRLAGAPGQPLPAAAGHGAAHRGGGGRRGDLAGPPGAVPCAVAVGLRCPDRGRCGWLHGAAQCGAQQR